MIGLSVVATLASLQAGAPPVIVTPPPIVRSSGATTPSSPPKPAIPVDPARIAAAEKLLTIMGVNDQYESLFSRMIPTMTVQLMTSLGSNADLPVSWRSYFTEPTTRDHASRVFAEEAMNGFRARYDDMRKATAREYAAAFSVDELDQISAFYSSPVGRKALRTLPELQGKLLPIGMRIGEDVGKSAMLRTIERIGLGEKKITS